MNKIKIFIDLTRLNKPIGFMLLFWPCLWGLTLALNQTKEFGLFIKYIILFFCFALFIKNFIEFKLTAIASFFLFLHKGAPTKAAKGLFLIPI